MNIVSISLYPKGDFMRKQHSSKNAAFLPPRADHGPVERWQHTARLLEATEQAGLLAARALESHLLDTLCCAGLISEKLRDAGLRFHADYLRAGLEAHLSGSYAPTRQTFNPFSSLGDRTDEQEAAYQRWRQAVRALTPLFADAVVTVACHENAPTPRQEIRLKAGLLLLTRHYAEAPPPLSLKKE